MPLLSLKNIINVCLIRKVKEKFFPRMNIFEQILSFISSNQKGFLQLADRTKLTFVLISLSTSPTELGFGNLILRIVAWKDSEILTIDFILTHLIQLQGLSIEIPAPHPLWHDGRQLSAFSGIAILGEEYPALRNTVYLRSIRCSQIKFSHQ